MLKTILSISGKPGLYKLISQGKNMLIVESVNAEKKRFPAYGNEKIISLADIAMYTDDAEVPLYDVLEAMKKKENELKPWHSIFCSWSNILGVSAYNDKNNQETHWRYCEI